MELTLVPEALSPGVVLFLLDAGPDLFRQIFSRLEPAGRQNHAELIAAQPGNRIGLTHGVPEQVRQPTKQVIAEQVTALIVDRLEVIHVDQHQH